MNNLNANTITKSDTRRENYLKLWNLIDTKIKDSIPDSYQRFNELPEFIIKYLLKKMTQTLWAQTFSLYAIILNREIDSRRLYTILGRINSLIAWAEKEGYSIDSNIDVKNLLYKMKNNSDNIGNYLIEYNSLIIHSNSYLSENQEIKKELNRYLLPEFKTCTRDLYKIHEHEKKIARMKRKKQVEPIKKEIINLVSLARSRWEWMYELFIKINKIKPLIKSGAINLPYDIETSTFDKLGTLNFQIWNKAAWIKEHESQYSDSAIRRWSSQNELNSDEIFFQFIGDIPSNSWFLRAIHFDFLQSGPLKSGPAVNYAKEQNLAKHCFSNGNNKYLLNASISVAGFIVKAKEKTKNNPAESNIIFQAESIISASLIGYLAILIISLTGMRIHEIQQLQFENSIKFAYLPKYNEQEEIWEEQGILTYIFETFTKGKNGPQKTYVPEIIMDNLRMYSKVYFDFHREILKPIACTSTWKKFNCKQQFENQIKTWLFQWGGTFLANETINKCINFALLEHNILDEDGNPVRITSRVFRHGFAGYLKTKGVPLEKIATLLHHVNLNVTDYYSQEPDEVNIEKLLPILNEIGNELQIDPGVIRDIEDIRRFEKECLKKFGALRKVIGGRCASFRSCEAMHMCASCEYCIPTPDKIHEIDAHIICCEKGAEYLENCGQPVQAERERIEANRYRILRAEAENWGKALKLEGTSFDEQIEGWKFPIDDDPKILPGILPCLPLEKCEEPATLENKE